MICSSINVGGGGAVLKELVTNLTDNETLINAVVLVNSNPAYLPTYIGKYQEGNNWVFQYSFPNTPDYTEFGAGAGLANFIASNFKTIAILLVALAGVTIVWLWRDVETKQSETEGKLSDNTTATIQSCLDNPSLTAEQKAKCIEEVLAALKKGTDWGPIVLVGAGILGLAYILGNRK